MFFVFIIIWCSLVFFLLFSCCVIRFKHGPLVKRVVTACQYRVVHLELMHTYLFSSEIQCVWPVCFKGRFLIQLPQSPHWPNIHCVRSFVVIWWNGHFFGEYQLKWYTSPRWQNAFAVEMCVKIDTVHIPNYSHSYPSVTFEQHHSEEIDHNYSHLLRQTPPLLTQVVACTVSPGRSWMYG